MAVGDAYVFPGFLTPVLTQLFFPKPPTIFLTCFCRGERRKYAGKKSRLNLGSNLQPRGHESDTLTTEPPGRGLHYTDIKKFLKNLLLWNRWSYFEIVHRNVPWMTLFKNCSRNFDPSKNMALVNGVFLHYMGHEEILKKSSSRNCWSDFEINHWNVPWVTLFKKLFSKFWSIYKHGSGEWGLFALYWHEEILKKSSLRPLVRFWNNFTEMFLEWPFSKSVSEIFIRL